MLKCSACYIEVQLVKTLVVVELKARGEWCGQRGVLCKCQFRVFRSLIVRGKALSLSRLVRVRILRNAILSRKIHFHTLIEFFY